MSRLDFDTVIPRSQTGSVKWDFVFDEGVLVRRDTNDPKHGEDALLPLWVADMDFRCPEAVIDAINKRVSHGVFGYTQPMDGYFDSIIAWADRYYDWQVDRDWIALSPGVVPVMNVLARNFVEPGEQVLIQNPVYYHFTRAPKNQNRGVISNDLVYSEDDGTYRIDFDDFEAKASDPKTTLALLCNPHNPSSRVWTADELRKLGDICVRHNVLIASDEVHCDLILPGSKFTPMASLSPEIADRTITMMAPSKTFNLAGFKTSHTIISNPELKKRFVTALSELGLFGGNIMGIVASEAAYTHGRPWLDDVLGYVQANYEFVRDYFAEHLPAVRVLKPEGTYLLWVDCGPLGFSPEERKDRIYNRAGVFLDDGSMFGERGANFERINIACPRETLAQAIDRMATALKA